MESIPERIDVLVVGYGPVGAALATLLERYGIATLVVDRATEIYAAPRAIALDNEALRVLQMCGIREGDIDTVAIPEVRMHSPWFGQYSRAVTAGQVDGHPRLVTFHQPQLEQVLRDRLATARHVRTATGVELVSLADGSDGVLAELRDAAGRAHSLQARYVVGADGASSRVRRILGQEFRGRTYAEDWLIVDARNLPTPIDHVEFICDPARPGPHMVAPGGRQRWEFKLCRDETREQAERPEVVRQLLAPWTGGAEVEIERVAVYRFHARVAEAFKVGRVMLAGDAAHITPPFAGQGLVAGLRDAANLAWKLAWVCDGRATQSLLDSYDAERRPHARAMVDLARMMGALVAPSSHARALLSHGCMALLTRVPRLRRLFEDLEIKPENRFRQGCFVRQERQARLRRGGQVPQCLLRTSSGSVALSDEALGTGFALVGFGTEPTEGLSPSMIEDWRAAGGSFVRIDPRGGTAWPARDARWEDVTGSFIPGKVPMGWVAVVRPDRVVMVDGPAGSQATLLDRCLALFAAAPAHASLASEPAAA